jgi:hypothetical protein
LGLRADVNVTETRKPQPLMEPGSASANFLLQLVLPRPIKGWTLTTLREKLIKIGAKVVRHSKYVLFQLAEVAVPRPLFAQILERIARLCPAGASG